MSKINYSVKDVYYHLLIDFLSSLEYVPEQDRKVQKLDAYCKAAVPQIKVLLAYFIERILSGEPQEFYIMPQYKDNTISMNKYNVVQLRSACTHSKVNKALYSDLTDFVYNIPSMGVFTYFSNYIMMKNITGIRVKDLQVIYDKYKLSKFIKEESLSDFSYETIEKTKRKKKLPTLKFPGVIFDNNQNKLLYFYKYGGDIKSNFEEELLNPISTILESYKKLALIGTIDNGVFEVYVCTTKDKVVSGLIKDGRYTLQNSFRYLRSDIKRVNNSLVKVNSFFKFPKLVGKDAEVFYNVEHLLSILEQFGTSNKTILFRNEFIYTNRISVKSKVIKEVDFIKNTISFVKLDSTEETYKLKEFQPFNYNLQPGGIIKVIEINKYKFIVKEGEDA